MGHPLNWRTFYPITFHRRRRMEPQKPRTMTDAQWIAWCRAGRPQAVPVPATSAEPVLLGEFLLCATKEGV